MRRSAIAIVVVISIAGCRNENGNAPLARAPAPAGEKSPAERWQEHFAASWREQFTGDHRKALNHLTAATAIARAIREPGRVAISLAWLGWVEAEMGHYDRALATLDEARRISMSPPYSATTPYLSAYGAAIQEMGNVHRMRGEFDRAQPWLAESYDLAKRHAIPFAIAESAAGLGRLHIALGRAALAEAICGDAHKAVRGNPAWRGQSAMAHLCRAEAELAMGRPTARERLDAAIAEAERSEYPRAVAMGRAVRSRVADNPRAAHEDTVRAFHVFRAIGDEHEAFARGRVGAALCALDHDRVGAAFLATGLAETRSARQAPLNAELRADHDRMIRRSRSDFDSRLTIRDRNPYIAR